jgi:hypothetical protein
VLARHGEQIPLAVRINSTFSAYPEEHMTRSTEAQKLLDDLDDELRANGTHAGRVLTWSASERQLLAMIADAVDRRVDLKAQYHQASSDGEPKLLVKVSGELRMLEALAARLLKQISTEAPKAESMRSVKARRAVNVRWGNASE